MKLCEDYIKNSKVKYNSVIIAENILNVFNEFGVSNIINEVTGYNMKYKIDEKLKDLADKEKKKEKLSEFNQNPEKSFKF